MGIPRSTPTFGFFLYRPFLEERFPAVVAGQEKAPDTLSHKTVFFYALMPSLTLARSSGVGMSEALRGDRVRQRITGTGFMPSLTDGVGERVSHQNP
jgi:hypothetical protein